MRIVRGVRFGAYEIVEPLGAGGMGEVYRARDTRLGRDVAIKTLPPPVALNPERRARFEQEARILASLNHPNIATLHGVEDAPGGMVLVMELVDGETLSDRIALAASGRGLPAREALAIAMQVATALEAAHEQGIVHRDLKPANIIVRPDGAVKVLDFGLAKALASADSGGTDAATVTTQSAAMGPGTPAYMSPEQARGLPVDKHTDAWAFGVVLYELLTGRRPFSGSTTSDVVAQILEREPDFNALPPGIPPSIRRLLRRCLEKNPRDRLRDVGDARLELRDALAPGHEIEFAASPEARRSSRLARVAGIAAISLALTTIALGFAWWRGYLASPASRAAEELPVRSQTMLPAGVSVTRGPGAAPSVAVSPDGRTVLIAGTGPDGQRLYRRSVDRADTEPIAGTDGGAGPFFSWDGKWIGFVAEGRLKRIPAGGGPAIDIVRLAGFPGGASWGPDDRIVFSYGAATPVQIVDARGGRAAVPLVTARAGHLPHIGPDGRTVFYASSDRWIYAVDRMTGRETRLVEGTAPRFVAGHVLFTRGTALLAVPFDPARHELTGAEFPVAAGVAPERGTVGGMSHYAVSRSGTLAYVPDAGAHSLVVLRPDGTERIIASDQPIIHNPSFSPKDGRQVVFGAQRRAGEMSQLWVHDLQTDITSQLTSDGGSRPVWVPDGKRVTYSRPGSGLYVKGADGRSDAQQLLALKNVHWLIDWTPDARTFAYAVMQGTPSVINAMTDGQPRTIVGPASVWGGRLSPDGKWLVYYSLDSGNFEVLATPFPGGGNRWLIADGTDPNWSPDGNEIYYRRGTRLMAVRIDKTASIRVVGPPRVVIDPFLPPLYDDYDVHPDGRTVVYVRPAGVLQPRQVEVVVNWSSELGRLSGASK
jgi:eukaryotic-like serine/threonine-protein kinase